MDFCHRVCRGIADVPPLFAIDNAYLAVPALFPSHFVRSVCDFCVAPRAPSIPRINTDISYRGLILYEYAGKCEEISIRTIVGFD